MQSGSFKIAVMDFTPNPNESLEIVFIFEL